jgi:hypothetical protein
MLSKTSKTIHGMSTFKEDMFYVNFINRITVRHYEKKGSQFIIRHYEKKGSQFIIRHYEKKV